MAPNGKCGRYPEAATFRITGGKVLQGATPTLAVFIQHLYDDHGTISPMNIKESEQKMKQEWSLLDPIVDLLDKLKKDWIFQKPLTPQSQEVKWSISRTCWFSGQEGWKKPVNGGKTCRLDWKPVGFQRPFRTNLQALPDPQESKSSGPWVWGIGKSYTGDRILGQHSGCATSTRMCSNGRQGGNGEPHQHQPHIIAEPNSSTRDNFGAFQATAGTTSPYQSKYTIHKENRTRSKNQGC